MKHKNRQWELDSIFHESIKQRRADLGLTQQQVEARASLRPGYLSYIETERLKRLPHPGVLFALGGALDFTAVDLLDMAGYLYWEEADIPYLEERLKSLSALKLRQAA